MRFDKGPYGFEEIQNLSRLIGKRCQSPKCFYQDKDRGEIYRILMKKQMLISVKNLET